jgi:hypothetical protein
MSTHILSSFANLPRSQRHHTTGSTQKDYRGGNVVVAVRIGVDIVLRCRSSVFIYCGVLLKFRAMYSLVSLTITFETRRNFPSNWRNTQITMFLLATRYPDDVYSTATILKVTKLPFDLDTRPRRLPGVLRIPPSSRCWTGQSANQIVRLKSVIRIAMLSLS